MKDSKIFYGNVATLVRTKRNKIGISQRDASDNLGFRNGQFISNIERAKCSFPDKLVVKLCELLGINIEEYLKAYLADKRLSMLARSGYLSIDSSENKLEDCSGASN